MKGVIMSYKRGRHTQNEHQIIIEVESIKTRKDAAALLGKAVYWQGKKIGKIHALHGNRGRVRALLSKPVPGQAMGTLVEIK